MDFVIKTIFCGGLARNFYFVFKLYSIKTNEMELLHKKLAYTLGGYFYDVHNALGMGYDEESYHLALEERLKMSNISFQTKVQKSIEHRGVKVHKFIADLIIGDKIILELKNIATDFHQANYLQILSYLKNWQMDLGLLVNFGAPSVHFKRILFTEKETAFKENHTELEGLLSLSLRKNLTELRAAILTILELYGLGYGDAVYINLLQAELSYKEIPFTPQTIIPVKFGGKIIQQFELKIPVIDNSILCKVIALKNEIAPEINKMKTYLKDTNLPIGLLVHFGKEKLEIIGIRP